MSIAPTLQRYLTAENIQYDLVLHDPTMSSARTAELCWISGDRLAKAIVLRRNAGYMLAVLPASHHLRFSDLRDQLGDNVEMAEESEIDPLFPDCAHGAVPPLGHCYALLKQAGSSSWSVLSAALTESRKAFDEANQAAWNALRGSAPKS
jgi:Ala-tRNA(Pro) deacylase